MDWKELANKNFVEFEKLFCGDSWVEYQEALHARERIWKEHGMNPKNWICGIIRSKDRVADCGCGSGKLFEMINETKTDVTIDGFDVGLKENGSCVYESNVFNFYKSKMNPENHSAKYNVIVYNMSFFERDITNHLVWAFAHLEKDGKVLIADKLVRFPINFIQLVEKRFDCRCWNLTNGPFAFFVFEPLKSSNQPNQQSESKIILES